MSPPSCDLFRLPRDPGAYLVQRALVLPPGIRWGAGSSARGESQSRSCSLEACVPLLAWVPGAGCWIAALRCASLVVHSHRWTLLPNGGPMAAAPKAAPAWLTPSVGTCPPRVLIHSPPSTPPPRHPPPRHPGLFQSGHCLLSFFNLFFIFKLKYS